MTAMLLCHGALQTLINQPGAQYDAVTWSTIVQLVKEPSAKPKQEADFFIPSSYRAHDGRSHEAQRVNGAFHALCLDVDKGNPSKVDLIEAVKGIIGECPMILYTSSGAEKANRKWRVLIPLPAPLAGEEYEETQMSFFDLLHGLGIHPDGALARCGQPIYLPNVPPTKRGDDGKPLFYDFEIVRTKAKPDLTAIFAQVERRREHFRLAAESAASARAEREAKRKAKMQGRDDLDPIAHFNASHSIADLLERYQYERKVSSPHWRSRYQSSPSYATRDYETHWVSLSGSDASAGIGRNKSLGEASYCWGDAFDLYAHYEHSGDFEKALRTYADEVRGPPVEFDLPKSGLDDFDFVEIKPATQAETSPTEPQAEDPESDMPEPRADAPEAAPDWPTLYDMFDEDAIEPRRWIYGHHYLRSFVSVLASAGGVGKTSMQIVEALAIVTGRPLLGEEVKERTNVWIVNLEDPLEEIQRRVLAAMRHYGIHPDEVRGRLFVNAGRDFNLKFGIQTREGVLPNVQLVKYLCQKIPEKGIGCVFIDPFVGAHSINENDNMAVNAIVAEIRRVADETRCAIGLVHHIRKGNGEDASIDSVRGAGSLIGAARAARVVNRLSTDDAIRCGIDEAEAKSIFRVDDGKANLAPPADAALYRKMIGVKIDNGEWIGVCVPFQLPDAFEGVSIKDARKIQQIVADAHSNGEPFKESSQSPKWVGVAVADLLGIDINDKRAKAKISMMVKTWMRTNILASEKIMDKKKGREMPVVVVGEWINGDEI